MTDVALARDDSPALRLVPRGTPARSYQQLVDAAMRAEREGQCAEARRLYHAALKLIDAGNAKDSSALFRWIGRTHQMEGELDTALDCIEVALAIAEAYGDQAAAGHATNLKAIVHWHRSELDRAEQLFNQSREMALAAGEARLAAMASQNLGTIAQIRGDFARAQTHYESGLQAYRALGAAAEVWGALNNLGMLHTGHAHWTEASNAFDEALQITDALGDVAGQITVQVNYAEHFIARGLFDRARALADSASDLAKRAEAHHADGELHKVYGIIARECGAYALAEEHLTRAQEIADRRVDLLLLADTTKAKADLHRRQGRNRDTLHCLNAAHRVFLQLKARLDVADVTSRMTRLENDFLDVVRRWSESIESKDHYTQGHCERVADLACALAARLGHDAQSLFWFRIGAMLHDVGKLLISSEVLNKPGPLTSDEWLQVKQHPVHGVEMLADVDFPWDVRPIVESHHERWDGHGYPHGVAGEAIPLSARILCIADVYDALTSERSYRRPLSHQEALDVMRLDVGKQFDPSLFPAFEEVAGELAAERGGPRAQTVRPMIEGSVFAAMAHDELTGLPLRRAFVERARTEIGRWDRGEAVSLLVIDVDHFKLVNDTYGHLAGDAVLRDVAATLRSRLRSEDFVGRYAGDEFVVLLPNTGLADAMTVANALREAVHELSFGNSRMAPVSTTISIGLAQSPDHGVTVEDLFAAADSALYEAKRGGRDNVVAAGAVTGAMREPAIRIDRFSGRVAERARLTELLDQSLRDGVRIAAIVGEGGIGKSSLVRELAADVRMRAGSLVLGRCTDGASRPALAPWIGALKAIRVLRVVPERAWRHLPRLFGECAASAPSADGSRFALFEEVTEYVRLAAAARPLVIALDDMHWADESSWDLLEHVLARVGADRVLFCLTLRDEDITTDIRTRRMRLSRDSRFREIRLARMSAAEHREWTQHALGHAVDDALLEHLFTLSEGNPFFSVQVLRSMLEEHRLHWNGARWDWTAPADARTNTMPVAVRDLLSRRVNRLSPAAHRILAAAAMIGRSIDVELVVRSGIATEEQVLDALDEGLTGSVLDVSDVHGENHIAFAHALLVDVMRETLNPGRRRRLHERIAHALEGLRPTAATELAHHFEMAGNRQKAFEYAYLAAEQAAAVYANDEALAWLDVAERHAETFTARTEARIRRATIAEVAGRYRDAEELHQSVLKELFGGVLPPARRAASKRAIVRLRMLQGAPAERTRSACRDLLAEAEALELDAERVALLLMLSQSYSLGGQPGVAEPMAHDALALAERLRDQRLTAEALMRIGSAIVHERSAEAATYYRRALALYESLGDTLGRIRCHINLGVANSRIGDLDMAESSYREALAFSRDVHAADAGGLAALNLGAVFLKRGRLADARTHLEDAHALFRHVSNEQHRIAALYNLAHLAREEHRIDEASRLYGATAALARGVGLHEVVLGATAGLGLMALAANDTIEAAAVRNQIRDEMPSPAGWFQGRELLEAFLVQMALFDDDVPLAAERFEKAVTLSTAHDAYGTAWLIASCAPPLVRRAGAQTTSVCTIVHLHAERVDKLGSAPLRTQFAALAAECRIEDMDGSAVPQSMVS